MKEQALFEKYKETRHWEQRKPDYAEKFVSFLREKKAKGLIVDIGCATGRDVKYFKDAGFETLGIDISKEEIQAAKKNHPDCRFEVQDAEKMNFKDNSVDAFFIINLMHYVDKKAVLKGVLQSLKPGGYVFVQFNLSITDDIGKIDYAYSEEEIIALVSDFAIMKKNKFERTDLKPIKHTHQILELILQKPA